MWNNSNSLPTFGSPSSRRTVIAKRRTGSIRGTSAPATGFQQRANTGLGGLVPPFKDISETAVVLPAQWVIWSKTTKTLNIPKFSEMWWRGRLRRRSSRCWSTPWLTCPLRTSRSLTHRQVKTQRIPIACLWLLVPSQSWLLCSCHDNSCSLWICKIFSSAYSCFCHPARPQPAWGWGCIHPFHLAICPSLDFFNLPRRS